MTEEEFNKIPFHMVYRLALENEHSCTYESEDERLGFCEHTIKNKYGEFSRSYRHWRIDNKVYKTKEKFLDALKDFPFAKKVGLFSI